MKQHVGVAGYGGIAAEELAVLSVQELGERYPNDGLVMVEETEVPGVFRHR
ncbi:hypothetical protein DVH05_012403 [Phytophthora capsici]|nr:hypothetical protein DVH05_012403 [Phytophthora capsici]